jgi:hypothetical protein
MPYKSIWVTAIAYLSIAAAILVSPLYVLWVLGGAIADRRRQRAKG